MGGSPYTGLGSVGPQARTSYKTLLSIAMLPSPSPYLSLFQRLDSRHMFTFPFPHASSVGYGMEVGGEEEEGVAVLTRRAEGVQDGVKHCECRWP